VLVRAPVNLHGGYRIPRETTHINTCAFESCGQLTEVVMPAEIPEIQQYAFRDCLNLKRVVFPSNTYQNLEKVFSNCPGVSLHGPAGSTIAAYAEKTRTPFAAI
jgi:hypothetical protein